MHIGMIIIMQPDLQAAVEFYKRLGFALKFHLQDKWAEFDAGTVKLGLCPTTERLDNVRTGIVIETSHDLHQLYRELKDEGIFFFSEPQTAIHGVMVGMKDPGGNVLDLYHPTPERVQELARQEAGNKDKDGTVCGCPKDKDSCCGTAPKA